MSSLKESSASAYSHSKLGAPSMKDSLLANGLVLAGDVSPEILARPGEKQAAPPRPMRPLSPAPLPCDDTHPKRQEPSRTVSKISTRSTETSRTVSKISSKSLRKKPSRLDDFDKDDEKDGLPVSPKMSSMSSTRSARTEMDDLYEELAASTGGLNFDDFDSHLRSSIETAGGDDDDEHEQAGLDQGTQDPGAATFSLANMGLDVEELAKEREGGRMDFFVSTPSKAEASWLSLWKQRITSEQGRGLLSEA